MVVPNNVSTFHQDLWLRGGVPKSPVVTDPMQHILGELSDDIIQRYRRTKLTFEASSVSNVSPGCSSACHLRTMHGRISVMAIFLRSRALFASKYDALKGRISARSSVVKIDLWGRADAMGCEDNGTRLRPAVIYKLIAMRHACKQACVDYEQQTDTRGAHEAYRLFNLPHIWLLLPDSTAERVAPPLIYYFNGPPCN